MQRYLVRRISLFLPTIIIASFVVFGLMRFLPGDVALVILGGDAEQEGFYEEDIENLREQLGLLDPFYVQYGKWMWSMSSGGYGGESLFTNEPIGEIIGRRMPVTLQLTFLTMTIAITISLPLGVLAALNQDRWPDYLARIATILGLALPNFWVALLLILSLVLFFHWSPPIIYVNSWQDPWTYIQIAIWPALVLAWGYSSYIARITRSNMLEVLRQDYVRTAYSKGLAQNTVVWRHALRNALIPVITLAGGYFDSLLGGTVILENIFGMPGMGQGIVQAAVVRDYPVIQSLALLLVLLALGVNLAIDLLYVFIDPRISYT
ncbi:MAG: hypothetical protein BZY82_09060 [SAR202 cluster bacterium Io17-Chloro-G3]|nr:MAG: hypothetical protein BZY82_09060 [SAR202 cluster bacterium Io17-Chloro-G3]